MATREMIQTEIEKVPDEKLGELYDIIREFSEKTEESKQGILSKLQRIKIQAPKDFAANFDLYLSGEKRIEDSL